MKKYLIEDLKCGITETGLDSVVASIKFNNEEESKWLNIFEIEGIPSFNLSKDDIFDKLIKDDVSDKEYAKLLDNTFIDNFNGMPLGEYEDMIEYMNKKDQTQDTLLLRLIIALVRADNDDTKELIKKSKGKYLDQIDIPISDIEEDM